MKESLRYLNNASQILKSAPVEDGIYGDVKPVREACGVAYLVVLIALDECLLPSIQGLATLTTWEGGEVERGSKSLAFEMEMPDFIFSGGE